MNFTVIIPARYASTRLPRKALIDINGMPMIQHVHQRALESGAAAVILATDNQEVADVATGFGAQVCMTSEHHRSGTERLSEVIKKLDIAGDEIIVNLQGDEPLIPPTLIQQVAEGLDLHRDSSIATLCEPIKSAAELFDPHAVKVVMDRHGSALYFSRAAIPWNRDAFAQTMEILPDTSAHFRHIGLYAYRAGFINEYVSWPPCNLETLESLEQLRALWHGKKIHVSVARQTTLPGVDTEADLERVRKLLREAGPAPMR